MLRGIFRYIKLKIKKITNNGDYITKRIVKGRAPIKMSRYKSVDGLKYILMLLVITCHYYNSLAFNDENLPKFIGSSFLFHYSFLAVEVFFLISGFFMVKSISTKNLPFFVFLIQRIKRLYPLAIFSTCIIFPIEMYGTLIHAFEQKYSVWTMFLSLTGMTKWLSTTEPVYNGPLWYIQVLLLCEILLYLTYSFIKKPSFFEACVFIVFISLGFKICNLNIPFLNESISRGIFNYFLGVVLYQYIISSTRIKLNYVALFFAFISILIIFIGIFENSTKHIGNLQLCVSFIISPSCLLSCIYIKTINRLFSFFAYLGKVTYSILSTHMIFIYIIRIFKHTGWDIDTSNILSYLLYILISTLIGIIFYEIIEKRFLPAILVHLKSKLQAIN